MTRTLLLALAATGLCLGAGVASPALRAGAPETLRFAAQSSLVFVGIEGDYREVPAEDVKTWLEEEKEIKVFGKELRALGDPNRRVWALETKDPKKVLRSIKTGLKKQGFSATMLVATAVEPLADDSRAIRSACRQVEQDDDVWTMWTDRRHPSIWVFHEDKLSSKKLEQLFRKTDCSVAFSHGEVVVTPGAGEEVKALLPTFEKELDALRVSTRDDAVVADLYLRDIEQLLILQEEGKKRLLCPASLKKVVPANHDPATWQVTIDNEGYPFLD